MRRGFAVEMFFDPATEGRLRALWEALARDGVSSVMLDLGSRPHISLATFERFAPADFRAELVAFAGSNPPLEVQLSGVGAFPTVEGVVFIAPVVTAEMLALHERFHRHLDDLGIPTGEYYRPGSWVPHCTAAIDLPPERVPAAVEACRRSDVFGPGRLVEIGLVEFRPVHMHYRFPLGGEGCRICDVHP